jgi:hypothetical protein
MNVARAQALIEELCGKPDEAAIRAVDVILAQGAALNWVAQATGRRPAPRRVADRLQVVATQLKDLADQRDPNEVLIQVAIHALAEERSSTP